MCHVHIFSSFHEGLSQRVQTWASDMICFTLLFLSSLVYNPNYLPNRKAGLHLGLVFLTPVHIQLVIHALSILPPRNLSTCPLLFWLRGHCLSFLKLFPPPSQVFFPSLLRAKKLFSEMSFSEGWIKKLLCADSGTLPVVNRKKYWYVEQLEGISNTLGWIKEASLTSLYTTRCHLYGILKKTEL